MAMNKVKITSQGKAPWDMQITDAETGELIYGVSRVEFVSDLNTDEFVAKLYIHYPHLEVTMPAEVKIREVEERATTASAMGVPYAALLEQDMERIRAIVREELRAIFDEIMHR